MHEKDAGVSSEQRALLLPAGLSTQSDLAHVTRELEKLDEFLRASAIRQPGSRMELPKSSKLFEELVTGSKLNMLQADDREYLLKSLTWMREHGPVIHMSFSTEPSTQFVEKLTNWLRKNISPFVLLQIGLRPNIGVGCVVRTTNKYFDFSLRKHFLAKRDLLMSQIVGDAKVADKPVAEPVA